MENTFVLDTDILIDLIREKPEIVAWVKEHETEDILATTIINIFEIFHGAYKSVDSGKKLILAESLVERLRIFDFNLESAKIAGKQKARLEEKGIMLDVRDLFIGSIALSNNIALKTNNKKHFQRIEGLKLA
jgi:tRNA(fMet)-specific endonuclease VapC